MTQRKNERYAICGKHSGDSRIGAPVSATTLSSIVNIFDCSVEARRSIAAAVQS